MVKGCEGTKALEVFERTLQHDPYSSDVLRAKVQLLVITGHEEEAMKVFQIIATIWPNSEPVKNALKGTPSPSENQTPDGKEKVQ